MSVLFHATNVQAATVHVVTTVLYNDTLWWCSHGGLVCEGPCTANWSGGGGSVETNKRSIGEKMNRPQRPGVHCSVMNKTHVRRDATWHKSSWSLPEWQTAGGCVLVSGTLHNNTRGSWLSSDSYRTHRHCYISSGTMLTVRVAHFLVPNTYIYVN
jgi:hypothetical protein